AGRETIDEGDLLAAILAHPRGGIARVLGGGLSALRAELRPAAGSSRGGGGAKTARSKPPPSAPSSPPPPSPPPERRPPPAAPAPRIAAAQPARRIPWSLVLLLAVPASLVLHL